MIARRFLSHQKLTREQIAKMKRLWRRVPHVQCKGLCQVACTRVPLFPVEALYLIEKHDAKILPGRMPGTRSIVPVLGHDGPCDFLKNGRCDIYDDRPSVCREFGHKALTLDCGHDCRAKVPLTDRLALELMAEHLNLSNFPQCDNGELAGDIIAQFEKQVDQMVLEVEVDDDEEIPGLD